MQLRFSLTFNSEVSPSYQFYKQTFIMISFGSSVNSKRSEGCMAERDKATTVPRVFVQMPPLGYDSTLFCCADHGRIRVVRLFTVYCTFSEQNCVKCPLIPRSYSGASDGYLLRALLSTLSRHQGNYAANRVHSLSADILVENKIMVRLKQTVITRAPLSTQRF